MMPQKYHLTSCVLSLRFPLSTINSQQSTCRLTYTGGYILPGTTPQPGQMPLPDDLEQAAIEQVAFWFQKRSQLGIRISWPSGGAYQQFATQDLLHSVQAVLARYTRWYL